MIEYRKGFVRVVETWFDEPEQVVVGADVLRCIQRSEPAEDGTATPFYTLLLDMRERPETLLAKMNKETRYEIRRAEEKDGIECRIWETTDAVCRGGFSSFYNQFAAERGLAPLNLNKLQKFADQGELILSAAHSPAGKALVWHSYYRGHRRVRLLHSATCSSPSDNRERSLLGRANRLLHWRACRSSVPRNETYDFGGWHEGHDSKKIAINQFKQGFGGEITLNYNCLRGLTPIGNAALDPFEVHRQKPLTNSLPRLPPSR